jgi:hypothetical protein
MTFPHGHGLGVLAVGDDYPDDVQTLFDADESLLSPIRNLFHQLGARVDAIQQFQTQSELIADLKTYENTVKKSRLMRAYRVLKFEGFGSFIKRIRAK